MQDRSSVAIPDPIGSCTALTASRDASRNTHLVAEEEVAALVRKLPEAFHGAGGDYDGEVVAIRPTEEGLLAGPAQGLSPGAAGGAQQHQEGQQQHPTASQPPALPPAGAGAGAQAAGVIINRSAAALGSAGASVRRSTAQALLLKVIPVQSRSWSSSSTLELTQLSPWLLPRSTVVTGSTSRLPAAPLPSLTNTLPLLSLLSTQIKQEKCFTPRNLQFLRVKP